jgi:hypothetical protein
VRYNLQLQEMKSKKINKREKICLKKFKLRYRLSVKSKQTCISVNNSDVSKIPFSSNTKSQALNLEKIHSLLAKEKSVNDGAYLI